MKKQSLITPAQAAPILGITEVRVRQLCKAGRIGQKVGQSWIIFSDELERFAAKKRKNGRPSKKSN